MSSEIPPPESRPENAEPPAKDRTKEAAARERDLSRRNAVRIPIHGLLVAIDAPEIAGDAWVVDAIDINSRGLGLVLPPELPTGASVMLSFKLGDDLEFSRLPATVLHRLTVSGGVRFEPWPAAERLKLLEYLVRRYETVAEG